LYEENAFITLTYSNENLPPGASVSKRPLQLFFKRLRRRIQKTEPEREIRYFACGEYGDKLGRPHYHACIFNFGFPDKEPFSTNKHTQLLYRSKLLEEVWPYGWCTIGEVTLQSAGYIARYVMKKIGGQKQKEHYGKKEPEFALMSRDGGIGRKWIEKYYNDVYPKDYFHINGKRQKPPRYYDEYLKNKDPDLYMKIKHDRIEKMKENAPDIIRLKQMENHKVLSTKTLQRNIEHE
jgi:hypothetical protein